MADQIQMQGKQQNATVSPKAILLDRAQDKLLKPRPKKMLRAIKMLDVLTAGDEQLYEYLKTQQAEAAKRVELAKEDMEMAETPEEAAEFAPDPMDELIAQDVPAVNTFDFEAFKNALLETCQSQLAEMVEKAFDIPPMVFYARCGLKDFSIHSISPESGTIFGHRRYEDMVPLQHEAFSILCKSLDIEYVEVYPGQLCAVYKDGYVKKYPRNTP